LARKSNTTTTAMDKSSFFFTANCGVCHPGSAATKYDRTGKLYFDRSTGTYGYNDQATLPAAARLDGDYGFINPATGIPATANWAKTGVVEADCLMCHMNSRYATGPGTANADNGLSWFKRAGSLRGTAMAGVANFELAATAGAGWASVAYVAGQSPPMASSLTVNYELGITAGTLVEQADQTLAIPLTTIGGARDANCRACHATPDGKKSGRTVLAATDVHVAGGVGCTRCHTTPNTGVLDAMGVAMANPHQIGKGDITIGSVRNDLDGTVNDCAECHLGGADPLAPDPTERHLGLPSLHFSFMKCQVCHIRHLDDDPVSATAEIPDIAYDMTSNGTQNPAFWNQYLGTDPLDPDRNLPELAGRPFRWYPAVVYYKGKLTTVKPLVTAWYGEWLGGEGGGAVIRPLPLRLVRKALTDAYAPGSPRLASLTLTPGTKGSPTAPILHRKAEIRAFLLALREAADTANPDATANDIVVRPVLVRADKVYYLNASDEVEYFESLVAETHNFAVNHNVVARRDPANAVVTPGPYGAGGCNDCHGPSSAFFYAKRLSEPAQYDYLDEQGTIPNPEAGHPEYVSQYELMGYTEARAGLLTGTLAAVSLQVYGTYGSVTVSDGTRTQTCASGGCVFGATPGSTVTFTAAASGGATFGGFMGCAVGATPDTCAVVAGSPTSGLANTPVSVRADFLPPPPPAEPTAFTLAVSIRGQGNVSGGGIDCRSNAGSCMLKDVPTGTAVTLTATGGVNGYTFGSWSGCSSVAGDQCTVTVTRNTLVTATYAPPPPPAEPSAFTLAVSIRGQGNVSGGGIDCRSNAGSCMLKDVPTGTAVTLTATGGVNGYTFGSWSGCSSVAGDQCTVTVTANTLVTATYDPPPPPPSPTSYALVTSVSGGQGTITGTDNAISCASNAGTCTIAVPAGASATLSAAPSTGYAFVGWSGCSSVSAGLCTAVVNQNTLVTALFAALP
jgi:hypothetical protein